jgi:hypothetical protein
MLRFLAGFCRSLQLNVANRGKKLTFKMQDLNLFLFNVKGLESHTFIPDRCRPGPGSGCPIAEKRLMMSV